MGQEPSVNMHALSPMGLMGCQNIYLYKSIFYLVIKTYSYIFNQQRLLEALFLLVLRSFYRQRVFGGIIESACCIHLETHASILRRAVIAREDSSKVGAFITFFSPSL
jgi:hypothetical protein